MTIRLQLAVVTDRDVRGQWIIVRDTLGRGHLVLDHTDARRGERFKLSHGEWIPHKTNNKQRHYR